MMPTIPPLMKSYRLGIRRLPQLVRSLDQRSTLRVMEKTKTFHPHFHTSLRPMISIRSHLRPAELWSLVLSTTFTLLSLMAMARWLKRSRRLLRHFLRTVVLLAVTVLSMPLFRASALFAARIPIMDT
jgi:hypothetical protein